MRLASKVYENAAKEKQTPNDNNSKQSSKNDDVEEANYEEK